MGYKTSKRKKRLRQSNKPNSRIVGILKKSKSNRYRVIDSYSEESYKISVKELRKAFVGDKVQCSLTPKRWVQIEKVLESNTTSFIGKLEKFGKSYKALPLDSGRHNYVNINGKVPNGKKLGFISQEMGREINTIGAKSYDAEMQKIVIEMKDELEKIKEQIFNIL